MKYGLSNAQMVDISKVFLDQNNPRHEPFDDQDEAIQYLCKEEQVLAMAKDIAKNGLNPLELCAIIKEGDRTFYCAEGNRRLCAVKLLNDPDLAPSNLRNEFIKASDIWTPIKKLAAVEFDSRDEVRLWLDRVHAGFNNGRGRRQWNAEQKARNSGYDKNNLALAVLDYGQNSGFISQDDRKGRISTVQRYLGNPLMRDALGLTASDGDQPTTDLPETDFDLMLKKFMEDVANKEITTRANKDKIVEYSHKLRGTEGVSGKRTLRRDLDVSGGTGAGKPVRPKKPAKPTKISPSDDIQEALKQIPSYKLEQIYYSICSLNLSQHTPLLAVGAWTFIETLTALCGRKHQESFNAYLSSQKMKQLSLGEKKETKAIGEAVNRIAELGNSTKHNKTSAAFNGEQLANDFLTMEKLLVALATEAEGKT